MATIKPELSRICTCGICEEQELTNQELLPPGWGITWEHPTTMCFDCINKSMDRWGSAPAMWEEGKKRDRLLI